MVIGILDSYTFNMMRKTKEIAFEEYLVRPYHKYLNYFPEFVGALNFIFNCLSLSMVFSIKLLNGFVDRTAIPWWIFCCVLGGITFLILSIIWIQGQKTISQSNKNTTS